MAAPMAATISPDELNPEDMIIAIRPSPTDENNVQIVMAQEEGEPMNKIQHFLGMAMMVYLDENSEDFQRRYIELLDEWSSSVTDEQA